MRRTAASVLTACVALTVVAALGVRGASPGTNPFTNAVSYFNPDSTVVTSYAMEANVTDPGPGFKAAFLWYEFCWPPTSGQIVTDIGGTFTVAPEGALEGACESTTAGGAAHRESTLGGTYDLQAQTAQFNFEGTQTSIANPAVATLSVEAPVTDVDGDRAEGTAPFVYTCTPGPKSDQPCGFTRVEGTVMFAIQFQPTLASEPTQPAVVPVGAMQLTLACASSPNQSGLSTVSCTTHVTGAPSEAALVYAWKLGGSPLSATGPTMQSNAVVDGTYVIDVTATDTSRLVAPASASQFLDVKEARAGEGNDSLVLIIVLLILAGVGAGALVAIIRALSGRPKTQT